MYRRIVAAIAVLVLCPAAGRAATAGAGSHVGPGHGAASQGKASRPVASRGDGTVLAEVGTLTITSAQIDASLAIPTSAMHTRSADQKRADARAALEQEIQSRLALLEFQRRGLEKDPRYLMPLRIYRDQIIAEAFVREKYQKRLTPTDEEIKVRLPLSWTRIKLKAIYFQDREAAETARPEILANAGNFDEMAAKYSSLASQKTHGGEYLLPGSGLYAPAEEQVLFSLKTGEISPVLDLQIMYAICMVADRQEVPAAEREAMRADIIKNLREKKIAEHLEKIGKGHTYEVRLVELQTAAEELLAFKIGDRVVAVFDGEEVTFNDLRNAQARPPEAFYTNVSASGMLTAYQVFLNQVQVSRAIAEEAGKEGFTVPERAGGDPMLWTILTRRIGDLVLKDVSIKEEEVRAYYDANIPMFSRAELYTVQKIELLSREMAEVARKRVLADPSQFAKVRESMSEEPFEDRHGGEKTYSEEFTNRSKAYRDAVRATAVGQVTPVLELDGRFLVLKIERVEKGYVFPYQDVRWEIYKRFLGAKQSPVLTTFIDDLRAATKVVIHQDRLDAYLKGLQ